MKISWRKKHLTIRITQMTSCARFLCLISETDCCFESPVLIWFLFSHRFGHQRDWNDTNDDDVEVVDQQPSNPHATS